METATVACPLCREIIPADAFVCGKCQTALVPTEWQTLCINWKNNPAAWRQKTWGMMDALQRETLLRAWAALKMGPFPPPHVREAQTVEEYKAAHPESAGDFKKMVIWIAIIGVALVGIFALVGFLAR